MFGLFRFEYVIFLFFAGLLFGTAFYPYLITNLGLLFFILIGVYFISKYKISLPRNSINRIFIVFILYDILHLLIATHFISLSEAYKVVITLLAYVGIYIIIQSYTSNSKNFARLNMIFAIIIFGESALAILQHFSENYYITNPNVGDETTRIVKGYDIFSYFNTRLAQDYYEARGTFGQKNQLGAFLVLLAPYFICLASFQYRKNRSLTTVFYVVVALFVTIALYYSYSRAAWLGFGVSLLIMAFMALKGRTKFVLAFGWIGVLLLVLINDTTIDFIYDYVLTTDTTLYQRFPFWDATLNHINATPYYFLLGYSFVSPYIVDSFYNKFTWTPAGHNSYLTIFEGKGLFGLIIVLSLLIITLKKIKEVWNNSENEEWKSMALGIFTGIIGFMVSQLFDHKLFLYTIEINIFIVVLISMTLSLNRHMQKAE
ncbi:MAG: hypothetical protein DWQ05_15420 [Calditrichaeota bacterium]|nr:MAG: hypothetical protein DWQ05_15420 [Calditrichota bacterium]